MVSKRTFVGTRTMGHSHSRTFRSGGIGASALSAGLRARSLRVEPLEDRRLLSVFAVTSTNDSGTGSLRWAIEQANANGNPGTVDQIVFNISGSGLHTIELLSPLPTITVEGGPVAIDGYSQSGSSVNTLENGNNAVLTIELNGASAGADANGLVIDAGHSTVRGLVINRFSGSGIVLESGSDNVVEGNFIGTDSTGMIDLGNGAHGVFVTKASQRNRIGSDADSSGDAGERNVISGNELAGVEISGLAQTETSTADTAVNDGSTALDEYVAAAVGYVQPSSTPASTIDGDGYTVYVYDLVSQTWNPESYVYRNGVSYPEWQHWLQIFVPDNFDPNDPSVSTAFLYVGGGGVRATAPTTLSDLRSDAKALASVITQTGTIFVFLPCVPNESLQFYDEMNWHTEDEIVAYTFDKYLEEYGSDLATAESWPSYLAMVNSAVRAMDAVQYLVPTLTDDQVQIDDFVISGASKRGWTTELTTAVDPQGRIKAMIPLVADLPNLGQQMEHHRDFYEGLTSEYLTDGQGRRYSWEMQDYLHYTDAEGNTVMERLATPEGRELLAIVDPFAYRDRDNMEVPQFYLFGAMDQFFVPGSAEYYIHDMQERAPTYLRYVPNAGHDLERYDVIPSGDDSADAVASLANFYAAILADDPLPTYDWTIEDGGNTIDLTSSVTPTGVFLWQATNPVERDFRMYGEADDPVWTSSVLSAQPNGHYVAYVDTPATGALAFMIEVHYMVNGKELTFTSSVSVVSADDANVVQGNYIGVNAAGTAALGNGADGVLVEDYNTTLIAGNVIAGNAGNGVTITGPDASGTVVQGNYIGTDATGMVDLGNQRCGVAIQEGAHGNTVGGPASTPGTGAGNVISGNGADGVSIRDGSDNFVAGNCVGLNVSGTSIVSNDGQGIFISGTGSVRNVVGTNGDGFADAQEANVVSGNGDGVDDGVGVLMRNQAQENVVAGNLIGTDVTGTVALGNTITGVAMMAGAANNRIGGWLSVERNVISGNGTDPGFYAGYGYGIAIAPVLEEYPAPQNNEVIGNYVGTDITGTVALGNADGGIIIENCANTRIAGNLISGNGGPGVTITGSDATGTVIEGNHIGTDASASVDLGNAASGVAIEAGAHHNTVGGATGTPGIGAGNVISGNGGDGILIDGNGSEGNAVIGNLVGLNAPGTGVLGNSGNGILIQNGATRNRIGSNGDGVDDELERNVISGNGANGITVKGTGAPGTAVPGNLLDLSAPDVPAAQLATALEEYVAAPDSSYTFHLESTIVDTGYHAYIYDMISQTWNPSGGVYRDGQPYSQWQHWLQIIVPDDLDRSVSTALLHVGSHNNDPTPPISVDGTTLAAALLAHTVAVYLPTVPNQPLQFDDEMFNHREDQIVAYTFGKFLDTGDESWPSYLPMVKSAIRAMDTVQAVVPGLTDGEVAIENFIITGGSKRGWTTQLATAVDPQQRVVAMIPTVSNLANLQRQMEYHRAFYEGATSNTIDGYSVSNGDYIHYNVIQRLGTPEGDALLEIIDPFTYRDRPTMDVPKYYINATGDYHFVPGSSQFFIDEFPGPTYLWYVPNAGHGLNDDADQAGLNFYAALVAGDPLPVYDWSIEDGGTTIRMNTVDTPIQVRLWQATNPVERDFRWFGQPSDIQWTATTLDALGGGEYVAHVAVPPSGATGALIEMQYDVNGKLLTFSTLVTVVSAEDAEIMQGNFIGTDITGTATLGNSADGVLLENCTNSLVADNVISGNSGAGIRIAGTGSSGVLVRDNTITLNGGAGVAVTGSTSLDNRIQSNTIHSNGTVGIDLGDNGTTLNDPGDSDTGPNALQNHPILLAVDPGFGTYVLGTLNSTPNNTFTIDFYSNVAANAAGHFEAEQYLGAIQVTTDAMGNATFETTLPVTVEVGRWITATATDLDGNTSELSPGTLVQESSDTPAVDFADVSVESYDPSQDTPGGVTIEDGGASVHITGNHWKKIAFPYQVTENTVLEFDFQSGSQGELQAIGFDTDNAISPQTIFQLYGTQTWGLQGYRNYASCAPGVQHYVIPVGKFFTGDMAYLVFANDDDVPTPLAESVFSNVKVYEQALAVEVQGVAERVGVDSYTGQDTLTQSLYVGDDAQTLRFVGNAWKQVALNYTVTADTLLEFDFQSSAQGEIQGIGFDNDTILSPEWFFQLYGTQTWGRQTYRNYASSADETVHYVIPVGKYFTGDLPYLVLGCDDDANASGQVAFSNLRVYEPNLNVETQGTTDSYLVTSYGAEDLLARSMSLEDATPATDGFQSIDFAGNSWKKIDLGYTITANTVLEFDFQSTAQGEIQGIGFDNDQTLSAATFFQLYGTQTWGKQAYRNYAASAGEVVHYVIPVGQYFQGDLPYLVLSCDDDADASGEVAFSNLRVYEPNLNVETQGTTDSYLVTSYGAEDLLARSMSLEDATPTTDGFETIDFAGNSWKKIDLGYTITANTVLEFDFQSTAEGEIQGIGFDNDQTLSAETFFQLYGTQTWGRQTYRNYASSAGEVVHYAIPIGEYFTGDLPYLILASDDDADASGGVVFSNLRLYEDGGIPIAAMSASLSASVNEAPYATTTTIDGGQQESLLEVDALLVDRLLAQGDRDSAGGFAQRTANAWAASNEVLQAVSRYELADRLAIRERLRDEEYCGVPDANIGVQTRDRAMEELFGVPSDGDQEAHRSLRARVRHHDLLAEVVAALGNNDD